MSRSTRTCATRITILTNVFFEEEGRSISVSLSSRHRIDVEQLFDSRFLAKSLGWDFDLACSSPF